MYDFSSAYLWVYFIHTNAKPSFLALHEFARQFLCRLPAWADLSVRAGFLWYGCRARVPEPLGAGRKRICCDGTSADGGEFFPCYHNKCAWACWRAVRYRAAPTDQALHNSAAEAWAEKMGTANVKSIIFLAREENKTRTTERTRYMNGETKK